jgi:hypothetical protein
MPKMILMLNVIRVLHLNDIDYNNYIMETYITSVSILSIII